MSPRHPVYVRVDVYVTNIIATKMKVSYLCIYMYTHIHIDTYTHTYQQEMGHANICMDVIYM